MKKNCALWGIFCSLLFPLPSWAEEGQEVVYTPDNAAYVEDETIVLPKFIDDSDLNFDNLEEEDLLFQEKPEAETLENKENIAITPASPPPEPRINVPILQKNADDILPSQTTPLNGDGYSMLPVQPVDADSLTTTGGKSLTETIAEKNAVPEAEADKNGTSSDVSSGEKTKEKTWLAKLKSPLDSLEKSLSGGSESLEDMVDNSRRNRSGSNASVFDISGIMLRMSLEQVDETMKKKGFRKVFQKLDIPNFIRWRNEETCRNQGVVGYERLESCVADMAKRDKHQYVSQGKYAKFNTKEEITVRFTSNFTNNKVYKIIYKSMASTIQGNSPKAIYLRNVKIYDFWKKVNHKYGAPDDKDNVVWGLGGNKPYMQASTGLLVLEDPMLRELDYTRMSREDQLFLNTDLYSF